jgi:hypothetical protein
MSNAQVVGTQLVPHTANPTAHAPLHTEPDGRGEQVPVATPVFADAHPWQVAVQAVLQQTPSLEQLLLVH